MDKSPLYTWIFTTLKEEVVVYRSDVIFLESLKAMSYSIFLPTIARRSEQRGDAWRQLITIRFKKTQKKCTKTSDFMICTEKKSLTLSSYLSQLKILLKAHKNNNNLRLRLIMVIKIGFILIKRSRTFHLNASVQT